MGETLTLTYRELADRLGISFDAAKSRARRAKWPKIRGNNDTIRLLIPLEDLQSAEVRRPRVDMTDTPEQPTHVDTPSDTHTDTALSALAHALEAATQRADEAVQRAAKAEAEIALAKASADHERTRAEAAETERDALKRRLDRPGITGRLLRFLY